jgi:uncharacterized repeat protein (TIGR03803 family)
MPFVPRRKVWSRVFPILGVLVVALVPASSALGQAQEKVLYSFCSAANCTDGEVPYGKLVFDRAGNLYGTTAAGGAYKGGTAFELSFSNGSWTESVLYSFPFGVNPMAGLTFDNAGNLYGTTQSGGSFGLGTVFELTPPSGQGAWTETVLWSFGANGDGQTPLCHLIFDASGNLYGATSAGGTYSGGTVFQLVPTNGGQWLENILLSFGPDPFNGYDPQAGLSLDNSGNLYGTTLQGGTKDGFGWGVVYKLSPNSQLPWTETVLFRFEKAIGAYPRSTVSFDNAGNIYGTLSEWGFGNGGGVFRLTPQGREHTFPLGLPYGSNPVAGVFIHGNALYGTTELGGSQNAGTVFKIQGTTSIVLYTFCSQPGCADGSQPQGELILRGKSLFGTATGGGANGTGGVVFQISETAPSRAKNSSAKSTRAAKVRSAGSGSH